MSEQPNEFWYIGKIEDNPKKGKHYIHLAHGRPVILDAKKLAKVLNAFKCSNQKNRLTLITFQVSLRYQILLNQQT